MALPAAVETILLPLVQGLDRLNLPRYSLAVYGPALRDGFSVETDPIHTALVVDELSTEVLRKLSEPLRKASRRARLLVFFAETSELPRMADCFSVKLLQIHRHRFMLRGPDPFASLRIDDAHVRVRLEQEMRNHLMRLRYAFVLGSGSPESLAQAIEICTRSFWTDCEALLYLLGETPSGFGDVIELVAGRVGISRDLLRRISKPVALDQVTTSFADLLTTVEHLTRFVDTLEPRSE